MIFNTVTEMLKFYGGCIFLLLLFAVLLREIAVVLGLHPMLAILSAPLAYGLCVAWVEKKVSGLVLLKKIWQRVRTKINPGAVFWEGLSSRERAGRYLDFVDFGGES